MKMMLCGLVLSGFLVNESRADPELKTEIATVKQALSIIAPAYGWRFVWAANIDVKTGEVTIRRDMTFVAFVYETLLSAGHPYFAVICDEEKILFVSDYMPHHINDNCRLLTTEGEII